MSLYQELAWRGLVYGATEDAERALAAETLTGYIGFDPTAASLHVGSLLPAMGLARLQRFGHTPIAVVGGGTGLIGDPSGKTVERQLLTREKVQENLAGIRGQLERVLDFSAPGNPARIVDNADWLCELSLMDFLRDVGKHFGVGAMLGKESVRRRLDGEEGISFTEFSYMLLQAYDFLTLHDRYGCRLQMGGSDQWGNIVAGIDLIRRQRRAAAHGVVFPLVTTASGVKFGKTEAGAVWLDPALTSPFRFYQFWVQTDDRDVVDYLKYFTWLGREAIAELEEQVRTAPERREAQRRLAAEVTRMVHGESELERAERATRVLFGEEVVELEPRDVLDVFADVPSSEVGKDQLAGAGLPLVDLLVSAGLAASKGEARRALQQGGVYLNNRRIADERKAVTLDDALGGELLVLRKGKRDYHLVRVAG
ncbi:MAG TPA: tyrosine--tRNA ligase [Thermoanaerobaculia bacterium]|nr:tyrosine--tRNA ligase [Thermoanaerobaculia bacterium]